MLRPLARENEASLRDRVRASRLWYARAFKQNAWPDIAKAARAVGAAEWRLEQFLEQQHGNQAVA